MPSRLEQASAARTQITEKQALKNVNMLSMGPAQAMAAPSPSNVLKRLLFWDFPRATWQYDVVVALILVFIFATPRDWFRDQPKAANIVLLSNGHDGLGRYFLEADMLRGVAEPQFGNRVHELIRQKTGKSVHVVRVETIRDESEPDEWKGFIAYTAP